MFLVGMPGSGKSTLGKELGLKLDLPFFDLDEIIELEERMTVPEIFGKRGEDYFRKLEKETLEKVSESHQSFVLATGGGTPCFFQNMQFMKANGKVVFIDVPVKELAQRLLNDGVEKRPLLKKMSSAEQLEDYLVNTLQKRLEFYDKAHLVCGENSLGDDLLNEIRN